MSCQPFSAIGIIVIVCSYRLKYFMPSQQRKYVLALNMKCMSFCSPCTGQPRLHSLRSWHLINSQLQPAILQAARMAMPQRLPARKAESDLRHRDKPLRTTKPRGLTWLFPPEVWQLFSCDLYSSVQWDIGGEGGGGVVLVEVVMMMMM